MKTTVLLFLSIIASSCNVKIDNDKINQLSTPINNDYHSIDEDNDVIIPEPIEESEDNSSGGPTPTSPEESVDNNQGSGGSIFIPFEPITQPSNPEPSPEESNHTTIPYQPQPSAPVVPANPEPSPQQPPTPEQQEPSPITPEPIPSQEEPSSPPAQEAPQASAPVEPQPTAPAPTVPPSQETEPEEDTSCNSDIPAGVLINGGVIQDWNAGYKYEFVITNNQSAEIQNWTMCFYYNHQVVNPWNATVQGTEPNWKILPLNYNQKIPVGGTTTIGWVGSPGGVNNEKLQSVIFKKEANATCPVIPNYCNQ